MTRTFSCASARSAGLAWGVSLAIVVETTVVHLWLVHRFPIAIWALTLMGLATVAWLVADYRAMQRGGIEVSDDAIRLRIGRRVDATLPRDAVVAATIPTWRELPQAGTPGFVQGTKPAEPNVLIEFREGTKLRVMGAPVSCRLLAIHVDDPHAIVAALTTCQQPTKAVASESMKQTAGAAP